MTKKKCTPEQRKTQARHAADVRWHPERAGMAQEPADAPGEPLQPRGPLPGHCAYDNAVDLPIVTYADALAREKAIAAELENRALRDGAAIRRGDLFTLDQVRADALEYDEALITCLRDLPEMMAKALPIDQREKARALGREWISQTRTALAAAARALIPAEKENP